MSHHFTAHELVDYARGAVDGQEGSDLLAHCRQCDSCGARLAAVLALREGTRIQRTKSTRRRWLATAASLAIVGSAFLASRAHSVWTSGSPAKPEATMRGPADELGALATRDLPSPAFLRFRFGSNLASTDSWEPRLRAAAEDLWEGRIAVSVAALRALSAEHPNDAEAAAYLGIGLYFSNDQTAATESFLQAGATSRLQPLRRYCRWYLANHYLRTHELALAVEILKELALDDDSVGRSATNLLDLLPEQSKAAAR